MASVSPFKVSFKKANDVASEFDSYHKAYSKFIGGCEKAYQTRDATDERRSLGKIDECGYRFRFQYKLKDRTGLEDLKTELDGMAAAKQREVKQLDDQLVRLLNKNHTDSSRRNHEHLRSLRVTRRWLTSLDAKLAITKGGLPTNAEQGLVSIM